MWLRDGVQSGGRGVSPSQDMQLAQSRSFFLLDAMETVLVKGWMDKEFDDVTYEDVRQDMRFASCTPRNVLLLRLPGGI
jgi:hypothetical protein